MSQFDPAVKAVLDILAPLHEDERYPIFEWPKETTPTESEMFQLALDLVAAVQNAGQQRGDEPLPT